MSITLLILFYYKLYLICDIHTYSLVYVCPNASLLALSSFLCASTTEAENGTFLIVFRMTCASACGESFPHAETRVPRAEDRLCMRRPKFHVRRPLFRVWRNVSACGDSCSMCGGPSPHVETGAKFRMLRKRSFI